MNDTRLHDRDKMFNACAINISDVVKKLRIAKGWDMLDLAFYSNVSEKTIYKIESGIENRESELLQSDSLIRSIQTASART